MNKGTKIIKNFLKEINMKDVKVRDYGITQANMPLNTIYYNYEIQKKDTKVNAILKSYYKNILKHKIKVPMETYAIIHELGHLISFGKDYHAFNFIKAINNYSYNSNKLRDIQSDKKRLYKYRNLKMERLADKYAYAIYLLHENEIIQLDKKLKEAYAE
jgi:hypothetical protein